MKSGFLHALILHILTQSVKQEEEEEGEGVGDVEKVEQGGRESGTDVTLLDRSPTNTLASDNYLPSIPLSPPSSLRLDDDWLAAGRDPFDYLQYSMDPDPSILADLLLKFFKGGAGLEGDFCYTWPVPGKPQHVLDAHTIGEFATFCDRTYQMMAYSGSWAVILDRCSDNDEVSFSVRLPDGISGMMMNCYESQALKLKSISNVR
jgi:hypothetical protein